MAIAFVTQLTSGNSGTSSTTLVLTTVSPLAIGNLAVIGIAADNIGSGSNGDFSDVSSVTDSAGNTWIKAGEATFGSTAAGAGVTASIWYTRATAALANGGTITITWPSAIVAKAARCQKYTCDNPIVVAGTPQRNYQTGNDFGSATISGLPSKERLYFRVGAKETNSATALTPTASYTNTGVSTGNGGTIATSATYRGEFRILTGTGDTSNPTLAVSVDTVSVFVAFEESTGVAGTLAATETTSDTAAIAGKVLVQGTLAATETALDTAAFTGTSTTFGTLVTTETSPDTAAIVGKVLVQGALVAVDALDTAAFTGTVANQVYTGNLAATEASDAAAIVGKVLVQGTLAAAETVPDTAAFTGTSTTFGTLAAAETAPDTVTFTGAVLVQGTLAATEPTDFAAFAGGGVVVAAGILAATETSPDTAALTGIVATNAVLAATETSPDTAAFAGTVLVQGALAATETSPDTAVFAGAVANQVYTGNLAAVETSPDTAAFTGKVQVWGNLSATETPDAAVFIGGVADAPSMGGGRPNIASVVNFIPIQEPQLNVASLAQVSRQLKEAVEQLQKISVDARGYAIQDPEPTMASLAATTRQMKEAVGYLQLRARRTGRSL